MIVQALPAPPPAPAAATTVDGRAFHPAPTGPGLWLWEPTIGSLLLDCAAGYVVREIDFGYPTVREAVWNLPLRNGTYDETCYVGSRAVTIPLTLDRAVAPLSDLLDGLRAFVNPCLRPWLLYTPDGGRQRRLQVRGVDAPAVFQRPRAMDVVAQFVSVGSPFWTEAAGSGDGGASCVTLLPGGGTPPGGRAYDWSPDRDYPDATVPEGTYLIVNDGSAPALWTATFYGTLTDPTLTINGHAMRFDRNGGLALAAGAWVLADAEAHTVTADSGESRFDRFNYVDGWPLLRSGENLVRLTAASAGAGGSARFCWRAAWY